MGRNVFISYRHHQADFVRRDLGPVLRAAGAGEVFIDVQRFIAGHELVAQMDATQDKADVTLAVLSPDYLASPMCMHELDRAVAIKQTVLPVVLHACTVPASLSALLQVRLEKDPADPAQWAAILKALDARTLGTEAPRWLDARRRCEQALITYRPIHLQTQSILVNWPAMIESISADCGLLIPSVDLLDGATVPLNGFVERVLSALNLPAKVPKNPSEALVTLSRQMRPNANHRIILRHLECARDRRYGADWVRAFRDIMEKRALVPLFQSYEPFSYIMESILPIGMKQFHSPIVTEVVVL